MLNDVAGTGSVAENMAGQEPLDRVRAVVPVLAAAVARIEADRELPAEVLAAMHEQGLFRLSLPRALGGGELAPGQLAQVTEMVATIDASAAW